LIPKSTIPNPKSEILKVVVAGEMPLLEEVGQLCMAAGLDTVLYLVEDFLAAVRSGWAMSGAVNVDVVIELLNESAAAKEELLVALGSFAPAEALILASALATSTTQAAAWLPDPARVVGFGLVSPVVEGGMVEVAAGLQTAVPHLQRALEFWRQLGMEPVQVADGPGLVRARTICCLINEAIGAVFEGVASPADIDKAMQLGANYPYGPLAWGDQIGLDTVLGVMEGLFHEWGEDRYRPSPLLRRMVVAGKLGVKTGAGFYTYEAGSGNV
jgi:3-hydroxybutyryl-CoA dehydrogenase